MSPDERPAGRGGRRIGRSVASIVFGFLVMGVVVALFDVLAGGGGRVAPGAADGVPADGAPADGIYVRLRLFVDVLAAAAGGFATAWVAPRRPLLHAAWLAVVVGILGVTSALVYLGQQPLVYSILLVVLVIPAVLLGGWLRARREGTLRP